MRYNPLTHKIDAIVCPGCGVAYPPYALSEHMAGCAKIGFPTQQPVAPKEPFLGLATTRELLTELAVRMEVGQNGVGPESADEGELAACCRAALANLPAEILDYRTVDGS